MSTASSADRFAARARAVRRRPYLLALLGLLVVALLAAAVWVVRFSSVLDVRSVEVTGVPSPLASTVRDAAQVPTGGPLAGADLAAVGRRVTALPAVESATVERRWPHTVHVDVTPRTPVVALSQPGGVRLVDRNAVAYATVPKAPAQVPLVAAAQTTDPVALQGVVATMAALPDDLRSQVADVTVKSASSLSFTVGSTRVRWGDSSQSQLKVKILKALLASTPRTIDVSAPQAPATS